MILDIYAPEGPARGAVAMIHGGFWRAMYGREGLAIHCRDLADRGFVAGNVGYRRVGEPGGGYPSTCHDVVDALRTLGQQHGPLVGVVGHSAGGQLALWAAKELEAKPGVVITVAGLNDLMLSRRLGYGDRAIDAFTRGDTSADPMTRLPLGVRTVLVSPVSDYPESRQLTTSYAAAATAAGEEVEIVEPSGDHLSLVDTRSDVWAAVVNQLSRS